MINFIQSILGDKRKLGITAVLVISAAIVLTVFVAQKQQEIRQRAAGEQTSLFFSQGSGCSNPITNASFTRGQAYDISICLNSNGNTISGFDIKIDGLGGPDFTGTLITEGTDGLRFNVLGYKDITNGVLRFSRVTTDTGMIITGNSLYLGRISLTASNVSTSRFFVSYAQIVSPISESALTVAKPVLTYNILEPTPIPTPTTPLPAKGNTSLTCPSNSIALSDLETIIRATLNDSSGNPIANKPIIWATQDSRVSLSATLSQTNSSGIASIHALVSLNVVTPFSTSITARFEGDTAYNRSSCDLTITYMPQAKNTPTPHPTSTPTSTPTPTPRPINTADINRDGVVDLIDFNLWLRAFQGVDTPPYTANNRPYYPDVISDTIIDLLDFNAWLRAFKSQ